MSNYDAAVLATPDLIAYYPLDELVGTVAADASGNGRHGTWDGATKGGTNTVPVEADVGEGAAATFASDQVRRIVLPSSVQLVPGDEFSMVTWANVPEAAFTGTGDMNRPLFTIGNLDDPNRCTAHLPNIAADADGGASFDYGSTGSGRTYGPDLRDIGLVSRNVFVACVASAGAGERTIYVNGAVAGSAVAAAGPSSTLTGGYIGWWAGGRSFERFVGRQAGVAFFRRALTFTEVRMLYCAGDPTGCGGWVTGAAGMG